MYDHILLEPIQEKLLITIVEAARNVPPERRRKFLVAQSKEGDELIHPGLPKEKQIYYGDIEILARQGLLALGFASKGSPIFDVTPLGFRYYEYLKERTGHATERIEATIKSYLDAYEFQKKYPEAYQKWTSAENLLWQTDTQQQLTTIGHLCREAVQEFADTLVDLYKPSNIINDKAKTITRLRTVLEMREQQLGKTEKPFLEALLTYWGTVNDLIQRQEHGGQKEGQELIWEDARRVVFQTAIVMFEIDKAL